MKGVENKLTDVVDLLSLGPSTREQTASLALKMHENQEGDTLYKRKISDLEKTNILKSHKIRRLQKANWRQKKQISLLKVMTCIGVKKETFIAGTYYEKIKKLIKN